MKINNCIQLLDEWSGGGQADAEWHAKQIMEKYIFKYTECGCCFIADEGGVTVAGYAEGSDADLAPYYLEWGFTIEEFNYVLNEADADGVEEWDRVNGDDLVRVVDENYEDHKDKDSA